MPSTLRKLISHVSLTTTVLTLTLLLGFALWRVMDWQQTDTLTRIFHRELTAQLAADAKADREHFDDAVQRLHRAAKLIVGQQSFVEYVTSSQWAVASSQPAVHVSIPPHWLPPASILRTFYTARYALLIDSTDHVREIYHSIPPRPGTVEIPAELFRPGNLLGKLSHNQGYLTNIDGQPYVLASEPYVDATHRVRATLILVSPIDGTFLSTGLDNAKQDDTIVSLIDPVTKQIVASSDEQRLPPGTMLGTLAATYMMTGKSFFDYGSSDLQLQFASFIPTDNAERLANEILALNSSQRTTLALALIMAFVLITMWIARRVRLLNLTVANFTRTLLSGKPLPTAHSDEIDSLDAQFRQLAREIVVSHERLKLHADERIALREQVLANEQRERELRSLQSVTETLEVGIALDGADGPVPLNELMRAFIADCGDISRFVLDQNESSAERHLITTNGGTRIFSIERHFALGAGGLLVRDITLQRELEEERNLFASFPAKSPNPILRIHRDGTLSYFNEAAQEALGALELQIGRMLPTTWLLRINNVVNSRLQESLEVPVNDRIYSFLPVLLEGSDYLYLYGTDITQRKRGEEQRQLAAAIMDSVLDGIVVTDTNGIIQAVNPAFTRITGYRADEVIGNNPRLLKSYRHDRAFYADLWKNVLQSGHWSGEVWNRRKTGEIFPCIARINVIRNDGRQVTHFVATYTDISERKQYEEHLTHMAYHDGLTNLPNRVLFEDRLRQALSLADRSRHHLAVLFIDLDGFKQVNDTLGHSAGDLLLQQVATRLKAAIRDCDTVCRLGGDEFALLLQNVRDRAAVVRITQKILDTLGREYDLKGKPAHVSGSIGIAIALERSDNVELVLRQADQAMYYAKQSGKNTYRFFESAADQAAK